MDQGDLMLLTKYKADIHSSTEVSRATFIMLLMLIDKLYHSNRDIVDKEHQNFHLI